jgi:hypothetical protein
MAKEKNEQPGGAQPNLPAGGTQQPSETITGPAFPPNPFDVATEAARRQSAELAQRAQMAATPSMGVLDELHRSEVHTQRQEHTFGAWCRAKGVRRQKILEAVEAGRVTGSGDGPMMTEEEFDRAVNFTHAPAFANLPVMSQHIRAADISQGREGRGTAGDQDDDASPSR